MKIKRFVYILLALCLLLAGCKEKDPKGTQVYRLQSIAMDGIVMDEAALDKMSDGADLYLKLFPDGTAEMRVTSKNVVKMEYDESNMWKPETPDLLAPYTVEGLTLSLYDGAAVYVFAKNP